MAETFRQRLGRGDRLVGSFVKTPAPHVVEIAGLSGLDFIVLDAEHGPFEGREIDVAVLASRAAGIDVLVRLPVGAPAPIQQALDLGAAGILVPHVDTAAEAESIVAAARFRGGRRGFSNSPRFADYGGVAMKDLLVGAIADAAVIVQIESAAAVDAVGEIADVAGIDALFVGRADLAVAYGLDDAQSPHVDSVAATIASAATRAGVRLGSFFPDAASFATKSAADFGMVILGSDQSILRNGWSAVADDARAVLSPASQTKS